METHHCSSSTFCTAVVATIGCLVGPAAGADPVSPIARVRSSDSAIVAMIDHASTRSPTLQRLVTTIEASNGIVYVEPGRCAQGVPACLAMWMESSGSNRFVRVIIDRKRLDSHLELLRAIGHELQHVTEVLADRSITDSEGMFFFYRRLVPTASDRFETPAAIAAGEAVLIELRRRQKADGLLTARLLATSRARAN